MKLVSKRTKKFFLSIAIILTMVILSTKGVYATTLNSNDLTAINNVLALVYMVMSTICGLGLILSIGAFSKCALTLAKSGNAKERAIAYQEILKCTVYTACLAATPTLYAILLAIFIN